MDEVPKFPDFVTINCAFESIQRGIDGRIESTTCRYSQFMALEHLYEVSPPIVIKINCDFCFMLLAVFYAYRAIVRKRKKMR